MEQILIPIAGVAVLIFVIFILKKLLSGISPMSKQEAIQHEINKRAAGTDEERYRALGKSANKAAKKGGFFGKLLLIVILIIIGLLIFSNF